MKSTLLVLLPADCADREAALRAALEPHRLNEDDPASIRAHHWDYWFFPGEQPVFVRVADLPPDFVTSGLITPDGRWYDLQEHGWRMIDEPSARNEAALARWQAALQDLLQRFPEHLAVEVVVHS